MGDIEELLAGLGEGRGGARLIRGEAGIGKSALLEHAARHADELGASVLGTAGVPSESQMAFAGLHRLLASRLAAMADLPGPQAAALSAAFGLSDDAAPDRFLIALAALDLLADSAAEAPLVLLVEDAHLLDAASWQVLTFVARRVDLEPIGLLFAVREGQAGRREDAQIPQLQVGALDARASGDLLDATSPGLAPALRRQVLDAAAGNPLALLELPRAAGTDDTTGLPVMVPVPTTARLERAFSDQLVALPEPTSRLLLVAAAAIGDKVDRILRAASALDGTPIDIDHLDPAEATGLVSVEGTTVRFRHPLVAAAIYHGAPASARMAAHAALADVHADDPDLTAWHRAASCLGPDAEVAAMLEAAAERATRRGAPAVAVAAVERAAQLTEEPAARGRRLLQAGEMEFELGRPELALTLLRQAQRLVLDSHEQARLWLLIDVADEDSWSGPERVASTAAIASEIVETADTERALAALLAVAQACWWGNPTQETRDVVLAAARRVEVPEDSPAMVAVLGVSDPVGQGRQVIDQIGRMRVDAHPDPATLHMIGTAATAVAAFDRSLPFLDAAVEGLRAQGRLGMLAQALVSQAWATLHCAKGTRARSAADEASRLARETGQARWAVAAALVKATLAGERGDLDTLGVMATEAEAELLDIGAQPLLAMARFARGRGAVAHQRYEEGYDELRRPFDPGDISYHPFAGIWGLADLVEAASHAAGPGVAEGYLAELERLADATHSPYLQASLDYARPLVADDEHAEAAYATSLKGGLSQWPCFRARLLLAYGSWLRRQRRVASSRAPLRAARESFDALGFRSLAQRAREELRASGEASRTRGADLRDRLTPQEMQIAQLAAGGLSNREIGQRLYLSHRTVGSHLYRMFPKLGVTSRGQLSQALTDLVETAD